MFASLTLCKISLSCSYDRCTTSPQVAVMERAAEHALRCSDPDVEHALRCLELEVHMRTIEQHCCVPSIEEGSVRRCIDWDVWHRNIQPIVRGVHQCTHWGVHHDCIYTPPFEVGSVHGYTDWGPNNTSAMVDGHWWGDLQYRHVQL